MECVSGNSISLELFPRTMETGGNFFSNTTTWSESALSSMFSDSLYAEHLFSVTTTLSVPHAQKVSKCPIAVNPDSVLPAVKRLLYLLL